MQAASVAQFAATLGLLAVAGTFFYFMVKAMARIQMPERRARPSPLDGSGPFYRLRPWLIPST